MLPEYFVQTELNDTVEAHKKVKLTLLASYILKTLSLIFVFLAFKNTWYLIGFVIIYSGGIVLRQLVLEMVSHYEYFFVIDCLKISVANNFNKYKLLAEIPLTDIIKLCETEQYIPDKNDIYAMPNGRKCIEITYKTCDNIQKLYFSPNRYLYALIENNIKTNDNLFEEI